MAIRAGAPVLHPALRMDACRPHRDDQCRAGGLDQRESHTRDPRLKRGASPSQGAEDETVPESAVARESTAILLGFRPGPRRGVGSRVSREEAAERIVPTKHRRRDWEGAVAALTAAGGTARTRGRLRREAGLGSVLPSSTIARPS